MTFKLDLEWLSAPGVEDQVLAATWARLEISVGDGTPLTLAMDRRSRQARSGVYGSVFPLARWLAENYWSLLWESPCGPKPRSARALAQRAHVRGWVSRHSLLAAREGFSLPDVTIARDGDHLLLAAFPDGESHSPAARPVSFISSGVSAMSPDEFTEGCSRFIDAVLERTRDVQAPEVEALRADWSAILESMASEPEACEWAGRLGLDAYDPAEFPDQLIEALEASLSGLPAPLRADVLESVDSAGGVSPAAAWALAEVPGRCGIEPPLQLKSTGHVSAHTLGYQRARLLRRFLDVGPLDSGLVAAVGAELKFDFGSRVEPKSAPLPGIDGLIAGTEKTAGPLIIGSELSHEAQQFRWARALYLWCFGYLSRGPRILSRAHSRQQREARAFAAELLVPSKALRKAVSSTSVGETELTELCAHFGTSRLHIIHQLQNHHIAEVDVA